MFLGFINVFPNNKSGLENKINPYGSIKKKNSTSLRISIFKFMYRTGIF